MQGQKNPRDIAILAFFCFFSQNTKKAKIQVIFQLTTTTDVIYKLQRGKKAKIKSREGEGRGL